MKTEKGNKLGSLILVFGLTAMVSFTSNGQEAKVEFTKLTASCFDEYTDIEWETTTEQNTALFVLQRSDDQLTWQDVEEVVPMGGPGVQTYYNVQDFTLSGTGKNYYRIVLVSSQNETTTYSDENSNCEKGEDNPPVVAPNPTSGPITVKPRTGVINSDTYTVAKLSGKVVLRGKFSKGNQWIDMSDCETGMYLIYIGNDPTPHKIWKN